MPAIARFYGIIVKMYQFGKEHNPPHIHVLYGECYGAINLQTLAMTEGDLPAKALSMAQEWAGLHRDELMEMWKTQQFRVLPPLE